MDGRALEEIHEQHETLMEMLPEMVVVVAGSRCLYINQAGLKQLGLKQMDDRSVWEFVHPQDVPLLMRRAQDLSMPGPPLAVKFVRADGSSFDVELRGKPITFEGQEAWLLLAHDVSYQRRSQELLHQLAYTHPVTGLPNRTYLEEYLQKLTADPAARPSSIAVVMMGLHHINVISDALGRSQAEQLLRLVVERVQRVLPSDGVLAHLSVDEFAILLRDVSPAALKSMVDKVHHAVIDEPFPLETRLTPMTCNLGVSVMPDDAKSVESLLRNADLALFSAKQGGRSRVIYYQDNAAEPESRIAELELEQDLRFALERGELYVVYQPKVDAASNRLIGVEALARWRHSVRGLVSPATFIPLAETSGLIVPIGEWLLRQAVAQQKAWGRLHVAINISVRQLEEKDFAERVRRILADLQVNARYLEFEITESTFVRHNQTVLNNLNVLRGMGIKITIDDFGAGYSSFGYLRSYQVDCLKIDQSFVRDLPDHRNSAAIVTSIVTLARALHVDVIAEGVETQAQRKFLQRVGCQHMQGYLFGRPEVPERVWVQRGEDNPFDLVIQ